MRFILVNLRSKEEGECAYCHTPIGKQYVRDLTTGIVYSSVWCMETHVVDTTKAIGGSSVEITDHSM